MAKIFIDGSTGTTGLRIYERLAERSDLQLITLPDGLRKDPQARRDAMNYADIVFLCLTAKDKLRLLPALNIPMDLLKEAVEIIREACE